MRGCCIDLMDVPAWEQMLRGLPGNGKGAASPEAPFIQPFLAVAAQREADSREAVLDWTFRSGHRDADGNLIRYSPSDVAERLGLPVARVQRLRDAAMRAVPLVHDTEPVEVVHECEHFLAVNKPFGVPTAPAHRYKGGSMVNRVLGLLGGTKPPHVVHRLDMDTSGVLLFAKTSAVVSDVHLQFRRRQVAKMYVCLAQGVPSHEQWTERSSIGRHPSVTVARRAGPEIETPTGRHSLPATSSGSDSGSEDATDADDGAGWQQARTQFVRLAAYPEARYPGAEPGTVYEGPDARDLRGASLVAAAPHTGRTHQIRVHMACGGHPLVGDELYGLQGPWLRRQALHAARLQITHPLTGQPLVFAAPVPYDIRVAAEHLGVLQPGQDAEAMVQDAWERLHG